MTEDKPQDDALFQEAISLMIHWQTGQHDPAVIAALESWRNQSPQHDAIWAEVMDIHQLAGEALASSPELPPLATPVTRLSSRTYSRRQVLWGSAAAIAAIGVSVAVGPELLLQARADFTTDTAQTRRIPFGSGSAIVLGPNSAINLRVTEQERQVELLAGLAYFDVSSHNLPPLNVQADGLNIISSGGRFDISHDAGVIRTMVAEGSLAVSPLSPRHNNAPDLLTAGDWLSLNTSKGDISRGQGDTGQIAAWRSGLVVADNEPLDAVISRISRWQPGKVLITSSQLANQRINGLYHLANPLDALKAAVRPYGGNVRQLSPWLTLITAA